MSKKGVYHIPVLRDACIDYLIGNNRGSGCYVDATFGGGGHSVHLLSCLDESSSVLAFDQDSDAIRNIPNDDRLTFVQANFRHLDQILTYYGIEKVDGILADLGVSSYQFDEIERGFSFRGEAELDMRMNPDSKITASTLINNLDRMDLVDLFSSYGEVRFSKSLSEEVLRVRRLKKINTTAQLSQIIQDASKGRAKRKEYAQVFQALRIAVNDEMNALREFLEASSTRLKTGGRLVVMSYHSLEDRLVKNIILKGGVGNTIVRDDFGKVVKPFKPLFKKAIVATDEEINRNPRARSVRLRVGEKI